MDLFLTIECKFLTIDKISEILTHLDIQQYRSDIFQFHLGIRQFILGIP